MVLHNTGRWILDLVWLGFLLFMLYRFWQQRKGLALAQDWLKTKGRITSCEWIDSGRGIWPKIEYTYTVYDKELVGEYLFLDTTHNSPNSKYARLVAYRVAIAFKENTDIDVFYNPNHPEQSALDITIPKKLNIIIGIISALIVLQAGIIILRYVG